ncbi:MAG: fluoride efflux transporter CrcB [Magnetococcus sp. DMHC-1]|nr:fluoride efflux transporter CrcB [Magnetococcales bacterium]
MKMVLMIAGGGALGSVARYLVSSWVYQWLGRQFPWGTLVVNVGGSFLMGFLLHFLSEHLPVSPEWRAAALVGFLGGLTTFSTFSSETLELLKNGFVTSALLNALVSVTLCVGAVWVGLWVSRSI